MTWWMTRYTPVVDNDVTDGHDAGVQGLKTLVHFSAHPEHHFVG